LLVGLVVAVVVAAVVVLLATGGSSGSPRSSSGQPASRGHHRSAPAAHRTGGAAAAGPAQLHVAVLNSTEINGLAHRVATTLQQHGFHQAQALAGRPPGTYSATVVEYAPGHANDAEGVARALGIEASGVRPIESSTQPLTPGASVVVVAAGSEATGGSTG
jgi:hypothetical protein